MKTFRSSPLIPHCSNTPKKPIKRQSKFKQAEYQILNPFRSTQQQNFLPNQLISQIQDMEFISSTSIKKIKLNNSIQSQRHSSNFVNHLKMMQNAAREQQIKFNGMMSSPNQKKVTFDEDESQQRIMNQKQHPMSIEQMDDLSMDMENCLHEVNYRDMDDKDFSLFGEEQEIEKERQEFKNQGNFYSEHCIHHQTGNTDLDCYLND